MLFKDENVSQLLSGLNFQIFLCAGSREGCTTGSLLKVDAQNGSLNFNDLPVFPQGGVVFPSREGGTLLLE